MGWRITLRQPFKIENSIGVVSRDEDDQLAKVSLHNDYFDEELTEHIMQLDKVRSRLQKNANFLLYFEEEELQVLQSFFNEYEEKPLMLKLLEYLFENKVNYGID